MRVQDLTDFGAIDSADLLQLLADGVPPGPRSEDLLSLADLAGFVRLMAWPLVELSEPRAGIKLCAALTGRDGWEGCAPASLTVWRRLHIGPQALSREPTYLDGDRYPSELERAFTWYPELLLWGRTLADIPEAEAYGHPNPRYLSVVRADAMKAFGFERKAPTAVVDVQTFSPASAPGAANDEAERVVQSEDELPAKRRRAAARVQELANTKGCRARVAKEFGVNVRTIGDWMSTVRKEDEATRKADAMSARDRSLMRT
jgi:hypothetical protein